RLREELRDTDRTHWSDVTISSVDSKKNAGLIGKTVTEIAALRETDEGTAVLDLLAEENAAVNIVSFNQSEENLRRLITHELCSVITDGFYVKGQPHPRLHGTYPELLGKLVRDRGWLTLSEAVHKSSKKPAARLNLTQRGLLKRDYAADIVVFDAAKISSAATYTNPTLDPSGVSLVIKSGKIAFQSMLA
ncbi:MAG TPA: amidohydrolase family protein, partial [Bryobacteraceae bacterium]|nr:amidohydrolase family protein [Bryobacteraceae bacterium]